MTHFEVPPKEVVAKIGNGDSLSDAELALAIKFYRQMSDGLRALGPHYHLACVEVEGRQRTLEGFQRARADHKRGLAASSGQIASRC